MIVQQSEDASSLAWTRCACHAIAWVEVRDAPVAQRCVSRVVRRRQLCFACVLRVLAVLASYVLARPTTLPLRALCFSVASPVPSTTCLCGFLSCSIRDTQRNTPDHAQR